jgi:hypothetical protein
MKYQKRFTNNLGSQDADINVSWIRDAIRDKHKVSNWIHQGLSPQTDSLNQQIENTKDNLIIYAQNDFESEPPRFVFKNLRQNVPPLLYNFVKTEISSSQDKMRQKKLN